MRAFLRLLAISFIGVFVGVSMSTFLYDLRDTNIGALPDVGAVLVLASGVMPDDTLTPSTARRVASGVAVYQAGKAPKIIFSGGRSIPDRKSTAELMAEIARQAGVPPEAILIEDKSFSTLQNGIFSKSVMEDSGINTVILVTESFHMGRSLVSMSWAGIDVQAWVSAGGVFDDGAANGAQKFSREVLATLFNLGRLLVWYLLGLTGMTEEERLPILV